MSLRSRGLVDMHIDLLLFRSCRYPVRFLSSARTVISGIVGVYVFGTCSDRRSTFLSNFCQSSGPKTRICWKFELFRQVNQNRSAFDALSCHFFQLTKPFWVGPCFLILKKPRAKPVGLSFLERLWSTVGFSAPTEAASERDLQRCLARKKTLPSQDHQTAQGIALL